MGYNPAAIHAKLTLNATAARVDKRQHFSGAAVATDRED
jgi:hypothetical protein